MWNTIGRQVSSPSPGEPQDVRNKRAGPGPLSVPSPVGVQVGWEGTELRVEALPPAWGRVDRGGSGGRWAGHLFRGTETSRKVATSSGVWFRASRVTARRTFSCAWGTRPQRSCRWMAWPRLATCAGRKHVGQRAGLKGEARPYPVSLLGRGPALVKRGPPSDVVLS